MVRTRRESSGRRPCQGPRQGDRHGIRLARARRAWAQLDGDRGVRRPRGFPREAGPLAARRDIGERFQPASMSSRELLVAGSVALDTLEGDFGKVSDELGGSALHFALAASLITPVTMIAPVGRESEQAVFELTGRLAIDTELVDVID